MGTTIDLVRRFRKLRVVVIGDAMLDTYFEGTASRICSEGPVPVVRKTGERRVPGGAANTAANVRALGADVVFLGIVGRDAAAATLRLTFQDMNLSDAGLVVDEAAPTLHKLRILADGQYVVRFDEDATHAYAPESHRRLLRQLREAYSTADLVIVSDYGYGVVTEDIIETLRALRAERPCPLLADSKQLHRFRTIGATLVTPNHLEARLLVQRDQPTLERAPEPTRLDELKQLGDALLAMIDTEHAAITLADDGVYLLSRDGSTAHVPAHPVAHANVAGAGDTFAAAMGLALAAGADLVEAGRIGIDAAGIAVTKQGTSIVQHQELLQRVSLRDHAANPSARIPATEMESRTALAQTMAQLAADRQAGRTIVFTNGVFDILHAGHVAFLRQAKALGDVLVVGVNSDSSARRLKGLHRPINAERDRVALVSALGPVDHVVVFDEDTPISLIRALRPDIHVKGGDYADEALPEADAVRAVGGRVVILPLVSSLSTTGVIDRIVALATASETGGQP